MTLPPIENVRHGVITALEKLLLDEGLADTDHPQARALVLEGPPGPALIEAARGAELLVVGARGLGEVRGLFLGSVSLHCVTHARCPIVVVRDVEPASKKGHS